MARYIDADIPIKAIANIDDEIVSEINDAKCNPERYTDNFVMGSKCQLQGLAYAIQAILETPTADVVEQKRGEWKHYGDKKCLRDDGKPIFIICSNCDNYVISVASSNWNYCPNCGAQMLRGEEDGKIH